MMPNTFMQQNELALFVKVTYHQKLWVAIAYLIRCCRAIYHLLLTTLGNRFYPAQILGIVFKFQKIVIRIFQLSSPTKRVGNFVLGDSPRSLGGRSRVLGGRSRDLGGRSRDLGGRSRDLRDQSPGLWGQSRKPRDDSPRLRYKYLSLFYLF